MICYGRNGKEYSLLETGDNRFSGGEGKVYNVVDNETLMAKIFSERSLREYRDSLYKHILWLSEQGFPEDFEGFKIAWPKDLLFSGNIQSEGQKSILFCGYIMQKIDHTCSLDTALTDEGIIGKNATLKDRLQIAYNYASFVNSFHKAGLIIGDFNLNNVLLTKYGNQYKISFIDCGGFSHLGEDLDFGARLWQEDWPEAPERKLRIKEYHTTESDLFYLAVVMFRIIVFNGNPFEAYSENEDIDVESEDNLANGICLYIKRYQDYTLPEYYPKAGFVPDDILELFNRAFNYDSENLRNRIAKRATAQEWVDTLYKYVSGSSKLIQCKKNKQHIYFSHLNECPWCNPSSVSEDSFEQRVSRRAVSVVQHEINDLLAKETSTRDDDVVNDAPRIYPNDLCPCGSGLKYKNCHGKNGANTSIKILNSNLNKQKSTNRSTYSPSIDNIHSNDSDDSIISVIFDYVSNNIEKEDYSIDFNHSGIKLTKRGNSKMRKLFKESGLSEKETKNGNGSLKYLFLLTVAVCSFPSIWRKKYQLSNSVVDTRLLRLLTSIIDEEKNLTTTANISRKEIAEQLDNHISLSIFNQFSQKQLRECEELTDISTFGIADKKVASYVDSLCNWKPVVIKCAYINAMLKSTDKVKLKDSTIDADNIVEKYNLNRVNRIKISLVFNQIIVAVLIAIAAFSKCETPSFPWDFIYTILPLVGWIVYYFLGGISDYSGAKKYNNALYFIVMAIGVFSICYHSLLKLGWEIASAFPRILEMALNVYCVPIFALSTISCLKYLTEKKSSDRHITVLRKLSIVLLWVLTVLVVVGAIKQVKVWNSIDIEDNLNFAASEQAQNYTDIEGGWGDSENGRPSYTIDQINSGALGDVITFNSISDGKIGDEKNFVGAKGSGEDVDFWNANSIDVKDGEAYTIRLYVHNNNPKGYDAVAKDVSVLFSLPVEISNSQTIIGYLDSSNAQPSRYWDGVTLMSEQPFYIEYVEGSARLFNTEYDGTSLNDEIITNGVMIGYDALNGRIPGCYEYDCIVTIDVLVHEKS